MQMIHCTNCGKINGFKRNLGFGTFFMVVLTAGFWLFALPFYPKRCIVCGIDKGSVVAWYKTWAWLPLGVFVAMVILMVSIIPSRPDPRPNDSAPLIAPTKIETVKPVPAEQISPLTSEPEEHASDPVQPAIVNAVDDTKSVGQPYDLSKVYQVGGDVSAPEFESGQRPHDTEEAKETQIHGQVVVHCVIDEQGYVHDASVIQPLSPELDRLTLWAIRGAKFKPAMLKGVLPVPVEWRLISTF